MASSVFFPPFILKPGNIFLDEKSFITIAEDKYSEEEDYKSPCYVVIFKCE